LIAGSAKVVRRPIFDPQGLRGVFIILTCFCHSGAEPMGKAYARHC